MAQTKSTMIFQDLLKRISEGDLMGKISLPTELVLAEQYNASRPTIRKAVVELQQSGYITSIKGSGSYITPEMQGHSTEPDTRSFFGVIFPNMGPGYLFAPLTNHLAQCATENGYSLILGGQISPGMELFKTRIAQICKRYREQRIQGLFFSPLEYHKEGQRITHEILRSFSSAKIPVVLIDSNTQPYPFANDFDLVSMDHVHAAYVITSHIIEQGAKRLFFLAPPNSHESVRLRLMGFHEALLNHGSAVGPDLFVEIMPEDDAALGKFLRSGKPEGILCSNDVTAISVMHSLERLGIRIPQDVALAGFDNLSRFMLLSRSITSIEQPIDAICRTAMDLMINRIADPGRIVSKTTFPGTLVIGDTTVKKPL
jgi:DNA-binding LacI/PurR family transcriptional regulator